MAAKQQNVSAWQVAKPFVNGGLSGSLATVCIQPIGERGEGGMESGRREREKKIKWGWRVAVDAPTCPHPPPF